MAGKKGQKQNPVKCDHCDKVFGSGAGLALHMRWVSGMDHPMKGKRLTGKHLSDQQGRVRSAQKVSPSGKTAGQRVIMTCKCGSEFKVVASQERRRKYCSKSCLGGYTPRGPLSDEQKEAISEAQKKRYRLNPESNPFYGRTPTNFRGWGHGGYCEELGYHVRSTWERDYLIALKEAGVPFEYEPKRFSLGEGKGTYLPDMRLTDTDFVEITGWDHPAKVEKRRLFCEVNPDFTLHVVNEPPSTRTEQELIDYCMEVM